MRYRERAGKTDVIEGFWEARPKIGTYIYPTHSIGQNSVTWHPLIVAKTKIFSLDTCQEKTVCCMVSPFLPQIPLEDLFFPRGLSPYNWGVQRPSMLPWWWKNVTNRPHYKPDFSPFAFYLILITPTIFELALKTSQGWGVEDKRCEVESWHWYQSAVNWSVAMCWKTWIQDACELRTSCL